MKNQVPQQAENSANSQENKLPKEGKSFLVGNFVKLGLFALLSVAAVVGTIYFEAGRGEASVNFIQDENASLNLNGENIFSDEFILRFNPDSELNDATFQLYEDGYSFNLAAGEIWANLANSDLNLNFWFGEKLVLIPKRATFDLVYVDDKLELRVLDGDVLVGLWDEEKPEGMVDFYSDRFMNTLLVPRDTQVKIPVDKISAKLQPLLPSKLSKEFKYSAIPSSIRDSEWIKENKKVDQRWLEAKKQALRSKIIARGVQDSGGMFDRLIDWSAETLTFVPEKRHQLILANLFANIDNALYYASEGELEKMQSALFAFDSDSFNVASELLEGAEYDGKMQMYLDDLSAFAPADNEYKVLSFLLEKGLNDLYLLADFYWVDVYAGVESGRLEAAKALDRYFEIYREKISKDDPRYSQYVIYLNQLFDNLFLRYSTFYRDAYFAQKGEMEQTLLTVYKDSKIKEELMQSFVQNKIDFLKRLRRYFFDGEVDVAEAKKIFKRLMGESRELLPEEDSSVAVIELFQKQLNDVNDFWGYLNSPEYHAKHYGENHEERYEAYLEERDVLFGFADIQEEVFGEVVEEEKTLEEVEAEVLAFFDAQEDISAAELGEVGDADQRYVQVRAVLAGYPFEAIYDRDTELLQEVYVYDELISERAINVKGLLSLVQENFGDFAEVPGEEEEEYSIETVAQRTARLYVAQLVADFGFDVDIDDISVFDAAGAIYRVEKINLADYKKVTITFDLLMTGEKATHVFMTVDGEPRVIEGEFSLEQLLLLMEAERDFIENGVEYLVEEITASDESPEEQEN